MDISEYLINILFDLYESFLTTQGLSSEEIDALYINEDDECMGDMEYLKKNEDEVICNEVIDAVYCQITEDGLPRNVDRYQFINTLLTHYYIYIYDTNKQMINYLNDKSAKELNEFFLSNYHFGMDLLKAYYKSLINSEKYLANRKKINEEHMENFLAKYERNSLIKVTTLNEILRNFIYDLYDFYIEKGFSENEALDFVWNFFINNFDPLGQLEKKGIDSVSKILYKRYILGFIYGDIYEDIYNNPIINYQGKDNSIIKHIDEAFPNDNAIGILYNEDLRNKVLKHFILLRNEINKMKQNRQKTYNDGRIITLKKVNPAYKLDELTFI